MISLSFTALRAANVNRQKEWPGNEHADVMFRALEVCGEAGELAEALKKYTRAERGIAGSTATLADVADEMGDVVISLDLLAGEMGIDLGCAVVEKFNRTSEKYGRRTCITPPAASMEILSINAPGPSSSACDDQFAPAPEDAP